ncbi:MAG: fructose 1,6-bisphosphatase [Flavobacteriales bacterium BRH_c54]|nr:MAG: fructose 1,6-bisphosphatase [Flavobacteriales bacterium BRH_c54]
MTNFTTLNEFILERQADFPYASGELTRLLNDIGVAAKIINKEVRRAGLGNILGKAGSENIQGEDQQKLDVYADNQFINAFRYGGEVCGIASEENDNFMAFDNEISQKGKYVVAFDPLDGSSNIDVNVSIGTIFSIYRRVSKDGPAQLEDFLQEGNKQVAAGYVIYGSSTMLVYTTGKGVNGFTLDPSIGEFCLSHPDIKSPDDGRLYSFNEGNYNTFSKGLQKYCDWVKEEDASTGRPYSCRYIASMVADVHRNLIKGGVFCYPATAGSPDGKLRLIYECNPMAFIVEQAGGIASTGKERIMDIKPTSLHQRVPALMGSKNMVNKVFEMIEKYERVENANA